MKDGIEQPVRIVDFPRTRVAVLEHRGNPAAIAESIRRFIAWRREAGLPPRSSATFNLIYDDPARTPPDAFRLDLCAATDREIAPNSAGIVAKSIPDGRCAVLRYVGSDEGLGAAVRYLYAEWLPRSGEQRRNFPLYFERVRMFPDVPENEAITDVYLPLRSEASSGDS